MTAARIQAHLETAHIGDVPAGRKQLSHVAREDVVRVALHLEALRDAARERKRPRAARRRRRRRTPSASSLVMVSWSLALASCRVAKSQARGRKNNAAERTNAPRRRRWTAGCPACARPAALSWRRKRPRLRLRPPPVAFVSERAAQLPRAGRRTFGCLVMSLHRYGYDSYSLASRSASLASASSTLTLTAATCSSDTCLFAASAGNDVSARRSGVQRRRCAPKYSSSSMSDSSSDEVACSQNASKSSKSDFSSDDDTSPSASSVAGGCSASPPGPAAPARSAQR